jgi:hypothetical protein
VNWSDIVTMIDASEQQALLAKRGLMLSESWLARISS